METIEAKILLKNLLKRIRQVEDDSYELSGTLTDDEITALKLALASLDGAPAQVPSPVPSSTSVVDDVPALKVSTTPLKPVPEFVPASEPVASNLAPAVNTHTEQDNVLSPSVRQVELDISALELPAPPLDRRLCLDFGTAMSKVTLVRDATPERDYEDIEVLTLGVPGDQEEVSETMLVSSVFIDAEGVLWFGHMAVQRSQLEAQNGERQRLDNIKRYLSEEGLNSPVSKIFNPTDTRITYGDMVLAYLMFLTWAVNGCLEDSAEPRNLNRRFAMPCFEGSKARDAERVLSAMLGEAQVLADTFYQTLQNGIPLAEFLQAVTQLRDEKRNYEFVKEGITEPLGVAGSIISWDEDMSSFQSLVMVIDVGAGTSDFSMYRMGFNAETGKSIAIEVQDSSDCITEAGNYLDNLLKSLILRDAGIGLEHPEMRNYHGNLELDLRNYKERLFEDGEVVARLFNGEQVPITLDDFLSLDQVVRFGESLKQCRDEILERIDSSFVMGAPGGVLSIALTGGGATLPMVKALAEGSIHLHGKDISLVQAKKFPEWLREDFPDLEDDYPRIAVSLGGARKRILSQGGVAKVTAGDIKSAPELGGYYTKG